MDRYVVLQEGTVYDHSNGEQYSCLKSYPGLGPDALLERVSDGWTLVAHGTRMDEQGLICWNYSTGGHWPDGGIRAERIVHESYKKSAPEAEIQERIAEKKLEDTISPEVLAAIMAEKRRLKQRCDAEISLLRDQLSSDSII